MIKPLASSMCVCVCALTAQCAYIFLHIPGARCVYKVSADTPRAIIQCAFSCRSTTQAINYASGANAKCFYRKQRFRDRIIKASAINIKWPLECSDWASAIRGDISR